MFSSMKLTNAYIHVTDMIKIWNISTTLQSSLYPLVANPFIYTQLRQPLI